MLYTYEEHREPAPLSPEVVPQEAVPTLLNLHKNLSLLPSPYCMADSALSALSPTFQLCSHQSKHLLRN